MLRAWVTGPDPNSHSGSSQTLTPLTRLGDSPRGRLRAVMSARPPFPTACQNPVPPASLPPPTPGRTSLPTPCVGLPTLASSHSSGVCLLSAGARAAVAPGELARSPSRMPARDDAILLALARRAAPAQATIWAGASPLPLPHAHARAATATLRHRRGHHCQGATTDRVLPPTRCYHSQGATTRRVPSPTGCSPLQGATTHGVLPLTGHHH